MLFVAERTFPSSKVCSRRGHYYGELKLWERVWECPVCKSVHDRDKNAAKNLRGYSAALIKGVG
nr:MAG: hypothetical protein DIU64_00185 [Caldicoprobacter oshimai]